MLRKLALAALSLLLVAAIPARAQEPVEPPPPESPAPTAPRQPAATFGEEIRATAVTVTIDVRDEQGNVPADLRADDFVVVEDGVEMTVIALEPVTERVEAAPAAAPAGEPAPAAAEPAGPEFVAPPRPAVEPWQVVVYFDSPTSSLPTVQLAADELAARASELAALGSVEIVVADPVPERKLEPTRDPERIAAALEEIAKEGLGRNEIARLRRDFVAFTSQDNLDELTRSRGEPAAPAAGGGNIGGSPGTIIDRTNRSPSDSSVPSGASGQRRLMALRNSAQREYQLLARQRTLMIDFLALIERPRRPHTLVYVSDGFDVDPSEFYLSQLRDVSLVSSAQSDLRSLHSGAAFEAASKSVAAAGWQVFPISLGQPGSAPSVSAADSGRARYRSFDRGGRTEAPGSGLPAFLLRAPLDPLKTIAEETGGELSLSPEQIGAAISSLSERFRLTYQVPRDPDTETHALEIRSRRPGVRVRAQRSISTASTDAMMAARLRHVLRTGDLGGADLGFDLEGSVERDKEVADAIVLTLSYAADLSPVAVFRPELDASGLRVTMVVELPDGRLLVSQERPTPQDLSAARRFQATVPLRLPKDTKRVAVALDDVASGSWGAGVWTAR